MIVLLLYFTRTQVLKSGAETAATPPLPTRGQRNRTARFVSPRGWVDARANHVADPNESRPHSAFLVAGDPEGGQISLPAPISVGPHA